MSSLANRPNCNLVYIDSRGSEYWSPIYLGSVACPLLHSIKVIVAPVHLTHKHMHTSICDRVNYASNGNSQAWTHKLEIVIIYCSCNYATWNLSYNVLQTSVDAEHTPAWPLHWRGELDPESTYSTE